MKIKYALICCLPFLVTACQNMPFSSEQSKIAVAEQLTAKQVHALVDYTWSHQANPNLPPIEVNFEGENRFSVATGCNQQSGTWQIVGQRLQTGPLRSTLMMCDPARMAQEKQSQSLFGDAQLRVNLDLRSTEQPVLTLKDKQGVSYQFTGRMKPEAKYQSEGETVFLEIAPETKPCPADASKQCFVVREITYNAQSVKQTSPTWFAEPIDIEGYKHDASTRKIIRTKRFQTKTTPASNVYIYDMTVEQEIIPKK